MSSVPKDFHFLAWRQRVTKVVFSYPIKTVSPGICSVFHPDTMSTLREFGLEVLHFKRIICFARIIVPSTFYFSVVVVTTITTVSEITEYRIRRFFPLFFFERNIEHFYRTIIKPYAKVVFIVNGTKRRGICLPTTSLLIVYSTLYFAVWKFSSI